MVHLIRNGLTRRDRAESIVSAVLGERFFLPSVLVSGEAKERLMLVVEEVLAEIEKPKSGTCH